ncbi:retrovirus-related pol polyprotein from transposon TNT 1-94 [Tanacetum coccineum]|uniref:Retrovirus-related pol polyprotein from transposon TNT 1-94 n=1 Tax=Tanacetum coccineum TaxID=301880 RepID=A0ABQ5I2Z9_9ASTR
MLILILRIRNHWFQLRDGQSNCPVVHVLFFLVFPVVQIVIWVVDSGCSKHMTGDRPLLRNFVEKFTGTVRFRNDNFAAIIGYEGDDLLTGERDLNLYTISISDMAASSPICLMSKATSTKSWLWHQRLSHLNFGTINDLTKLDLVDGLPKFKYGKDHLCSACERGKSKKASHPPKLIPSDYSKLELLHMDLFTWVYFIRSKDETPEIIKKFIAQAQLNYKDKVCKIRTDNGTEFKNATLKAYYEKLEDSPSTSSIIIDTHEAPHVVTTSDEQTSPISLQESDEFNQEDSANFDGNFTSVQPSTHIWTKDHPLDQVIGDPSKPVMTRQRLHTDSEVCMYALTISTIEPKNIKEAMADHSWIESMQDELNQFERLQVWELVPRLEGKNVIALKWICAKIKCDAWILLFGSETKTRLLGLLRLKKVLLDQGIILSVGIFISQSQYAIELLKKHGLDECVSMSTPMATERPNADLQGTPTDQTTYRYADHAGCKDDCKSTSGGLQFLGGKLGAYGCILDASMRIEFLLSLCHFRSNLPFRIHRFTRSSKTKEIKGWHANSRLDVQLREMKDTQSILGCMQRCLGLDVPLTLVTTDWDAPTVVKADEMTIQDTLQGPSWLSTKVEKSIRSLANMVETEDDEITDEVYELKRREKGKIREGSLGVHQSHVLIRSPRKSFDTLANHLQEVMVESLPIMVYTYIKEQVKKQVPKQVRDQVQVLLRLPRDRDDPHGEYPEGENSAKQQKTSEYEAYVSGESCLDKVIMKGRRVSQDIVEKNSLLLMKQVRKKMADEMLRQRCTSGDEHQYHIDQMKNFLKSDIVWESRKEILVSPHPKTPTVASRS